MSESRHEPIDRAAFAFFAQGLLRPDLLDPTPIPRGAYWPKYQPLHQAVRHATYIQPLTTELEHALTEKLSPEDESRFHEAILEELIAADKAALEAQPEASNDAGE